MSSPSANELVKGYVPRNVSKFPIEQTYLTSDSEPTSTGYRFKMPEVWTSARSGKKSIAVRSITHLAEPVSISFKLIIDPGSPNPYVGFLYSSSFKPSASFYDIISDICSVVKSVYPDLTLAYIFSNNTLSLEVFDSDNNYYPFKIIKFDADQTTTTPSESFNRFLNQPLDTISDFKQKQTYTNVWDRRNLYFHASFIPFDTYQFLGSVDTIYPHPIVYQDPNSSHLFNVWTTSDLKTPFQVLHERFIIRISYIISTESSYENI